MTTKTTTAKIANLEIVDDRPEVKSLWVSATVDGVRLGAWIETDGSVTWNDHEVWSIETDLKDAGIDPGSEEAVRLLEAWAEYIDRHAEEWLSC